MENLNITLKEWIETEEYNCENCPYKQVYGCNCEGEVRCYGGNPIYPPCAEGYFDSYDQQKTLQDIINEMESYNFRYEQSEERRSQAQKLKEEKKKERIAKAKSMLGYILSKQKHITIEVKEKSIVEQLITMWSRLWHRARYNATWYFHTSLMSTILTLEFNDKSLYKNNHTIFGRPVVFTDNCAEGGKIGDIILTNINWLDKAEEVLSQITLPFKPYQSSILVSNFIVLGERKL